MPETKSIYRSAHWVINSACNFKCPYCCDNVFQKPINSLSLGNLNIQPIIDFLIKNGRWNEITLAGGEPFLHPKFLEICKKLTEAKQKISLNTNLSSPLVHKFAEIINPKKASVTCSLHLPMLEKFDLKNEFIKKNNLLKDKGFNIISTMVMWPPIFEDFDKTYLFFEKNGVKIFPAVFFGNYAGKIYPKSYTFLQRRIIRKYSPIRDRKHPHLIKGLPSYQGRPCHTGLVRIIIEQSGQIFRCVSDKNSLGNIFNGDVKLFSKIEVCNSPLCKCPSEGYYFSEEKPMVGAKTFKEKLDKIKKRILTIQTSNYFFI